MRFRKPRRAMRRRRPRSFRGKYKARRRGVAGKRIGYRW